jgi:hypothetical protein
MEISRFIREEYGVKEPHAIATQVHDRLPGGDIGIPFMPDAGGIERAEKQTWPKERTESVYRITISV